MAWSEKTTRSGKTRYYGRYRNRDGAKCRLDETFPTAKAARNAASSQEQRIQNEPARPDSLITWGQWCEKWWPTRKVAPSTAHRDAGRLHKHLEPKWSDTQLATIRRVHVQQWVDELATTLSPRSVTRCYHLFSASMKAATAAELIAASPCTAIELPALAPPDPRFLNLEQMNNLLRQIQAPWARTLTTLMVGAGLRWGEAIGLHWNRVDLDAGVLDVRETYDIREGEIVAYPKGKAARGVPLSPWVVSALREHQRDYPRAEHCNVPHRSETGQRHPQPCRSGLVVPGQWRGTDQWCVDYDVFRRTHFDPAVKRAEVGHVTPTDLRHTYASWLVQNGASLYVVRDLLGHASITTTERHYASLGRMHWSQVRETLPDPTRDSSVKDWGNSAPKSAPQDQLISESKIVDLDRFRRSQ